MTSAERKERIKLLQKQAELMKKSGLKRQDELASYYNVLLEIEKVQRIEEGFQDIMVFAKNYFTGEPPHDILKPDTPSPEFHFELASILRKALLSKDTQKIAIAAPRSHAKSSIVTNILLLWNICYIDDIHEHYFLIISDKQDNARRFLDVIKSELEDNQDLIADFGDLKGDTWNALEIVTKNKVKISAHGAGEALRGLRYGSFRPSVVCDDIESDQSVNTKDQIDKMVTWFFRTVMPLGDPKHSKFFFVGTIIHYNSLLNQVLNEHADWKAFKFKAIEEFPERMDLWQRWEDMLFDRSEGNNPMESSRIAHEKAMNFYKENLDEMEKGAKILWKERLPLIKLMEIRAMTRLSFNSEYQNQPLDEQSRIFSKLHFYEPDDIRLDDLDIYGACDPSITTTKRSDPSAIITVGRHKKTGVIYVLDADAKRRNPNVLIQDIFRKADAFNYVGFSIETVAFQEFFKSEVEKRSAEQGVYLPVKPFKSTTKKEIRISAMEPLISSGYVRFLPSQKDLIEELEYFPKSTHDDLIDALAQALDIAKKKGSGFIFSKL